MTSQTFFLIFVPILSIILLSINLIFAPHNPYEEKDSAFECGFHSFLGQNRSEFSISFFIFALLFLLFDLEILLVYPYVVSSYVNGVFGLIIMLLFFIILTLGFAFELGKNALTIESRQVSWKQDVTESTKLISGLFGYDPPGPHAFVHAPKQGGFDHIIKSFVSFLQTRYNKYVNTVVFFIAMLSMFYPIKITVAILGTEFNNSQLFLIHVLICFHIGVVCRNLFVNHRLPRRVEYGWGLLMCVAISIFTYCIIPDLAYTFLPAFAPLLVFIQHFSINYIVPSSLREFFSCKIPNYELYTAVHSQGEVPKPYVEPPKTGKTLYMNNNGEGSSSGAGSGNNQGKLPFGASYSQGDYLKYDPVHNPLVYHPEYNPTGYHPEVNPYSFHPYYNPSVFHPFCNPTGYSPFGNPLDPNYHIPVSPVVPQSQLPVSPVVPQSQVPVSPVVPQSQVPARPVVPQSQVSARPQGLRPLAPRLQPLIHTQPGLQPAVHPQLNPQLQPPLITSFNGLTEAEWLGLVDRVEAHMRSQGNALVNFRVMSDAIGASDRQIEAIRDYLAKVEDIKFKRGYNLYNFSLNGRTVRGGIIERMRAAR